MYDGSQENSLSYYVRSIFHGLYYMSDQKLKSYGITNQQGHLLGIIYDNIQLGHTISRRFLEELMHLRGPSVTNLLNCLEEKGYISRSVSKTDGRAMQLLVTSKGQQLIKDIRNIFLETELKLQTGMTEEEKDMLKKLLLRVYHNLPEES
jgi:MarR family transcriptional repressor of mepA